MKIIQDNKYIYANYIPSDEVFKEGLTFFSDTSEFIQVGSWNYNNGKQLKAHKHNSFDRLTNITQEAIFVYKGLLNASIYDSENNFMEKIQLSSGDLLVVLMGGHGYEILQDNTLVLEFKNGPYFGPDKDRVRLNNEQK